MKKQLIYVLLAILLIANLALTGCFEEEKKEKPFVIELIGKGHKVYAGDSTTYIIFVTNNQDENDSISLSIASSPTGWNVFVNQTTFNLTQKGTDGDALGIFVVINASTDASKGDYKVKILAISELDGAKTSVTITTKVIDDDGKTVRIGDKVSVDYLGYLGEYAVFDTSIEDIGLEWRIRKTSDWGSRGFLPLKVYVGEEDPDPQDQYISTVEGFWEAIEGLKVGQSRTVVIPPAKAYGKFENATVNKTEDVNIFENLTFADFQNNYGGQPLEGLVLKHYFWEWNITIDYVNEDDDIIRIFNEPELNQTVTPYGWDSKVIYKNQSDYGGEGRISVQHTVVEGQQGVYENLTAYVTSVEGDEIKLEYNSSSHNLANDILIFDITVVDILD